MVTTVTLAVSLEILQVTNRRNSRKDFRTFLGSSKCPIGTQIPGCIACFYCSAKIKICAHTLFSKYKIHVTSPQMFGFITLLRGDSTAHFLSPYLLHLPRFYSAPDSYYQKNELALPRNLHIRTWIIDT